MRLIKKLFFTGVFFVISAGIFSGSLLSAEDAAEKAEADIVSGGDEMLPDGDDVIMEDMGALDDKSLMQGSEMTGSSGKEWWIPARPYKVWDEKQLDKWLEVLTNFRVELMETNGDPSIIKSVDEQIRDVRTTLARIPFRDGEE